MSRGDMTSACAGMHAVSAMTAAASVCIVVLSIIVSEKKCNYEMSVISGRTNPPASFQKYSVVLLNGNLPCHNAFDSLNAYDIVSGSIHTAFVASESSGHDSVGAVDLCI